MAVHDKRMCTVVSTRSRLLPTSRVCSSLNGSILQAAPRRTDGQLPREHFHSHDTPEVCRLGMPRNSTKVSLSPRARPFPNKPARARAPLRREPPRKFWPFVRPQTQFHRASQVLLLRSMHAQNLRLFAPPPCLPRRPKSGPTFVMHQSLR